MAERALTKKNETAQSDTVGNNPRSKLYVKYDYETGPGLPLKEFLSPNIVPVTDFP